MSSKGSPLLAAATTSSVRAASIRASASAAFSTVLASTPKVAANAGFAAAGAQGADGFTVDDFEYVVLIDGNGLARLESWTYAGTQNGQSVSYSWEYTLTGVGETTVEDPDWLDEAVAAAG